MESTQKQVFVYLQASIVGTLVNFLSRFPLSEIFGFEISVILATYVGMIIVFLMSFRRAFGVQRLEKGMIWRFIIVSHVGLATVWIFSNLAMFCVKLVNLDMLLAEKCSSLSSQLASLIPRFIEGFCHGIGIIIGFFVNFLGHRSYSFAYDTDPENIHASTVFAVLVPLGYLILYAPYGMDTTDFGFFYGYPWHILQGEVPYRDFYYTKPPVSLYWHAFWLWISPEKISVLCGKIGFLAEMLISSWLGVLFLGKIFDLHKIPLPLLATTAFVFSVHCFPAMPWHTADGTLFSSAALYLTVCENRKFALLAGIMAGLAVLTKQSFLLIPLASCVVALAHHSLWYAAKIAIGTVVILAGFAGICISLGIWENFLAQTTGGLDFKEAAEAGIWIYTKQNMILPIAAIDTAGLLWLSKRFVDPSCSSWMSRFQPVPLYFIALTLWYINDAMTSQEWIGSGVSWSTLLVIFGGMMVLFPKTFLYPFARKNLPHSILHPLAPSLGFGAALILAWSTGISGGYKSPAFFAAPLICTALLIHLYLKKHRISYWQGSSLLWMILFCGILMFRFGYERPYVFPIRDMPRSSLIYDAGSVYKQMAGVLVDQENFEILKELKQLRQKYGANYKTLPAFPMAYFLNGDKPVLPAEWLQDWEIHWESEKVYNLLVKRNIIVFFEKSQLDVLSPDAYERTRYTVPHRVRCEWRQIDETRHFVVYSYN